MDIDNLQLPSFTEIQAARTPTLRHVPVAARHTWNHILTRALAAVVHRNDERAWRELLMLPQCLLCAPTRGGRRHSKAVAAYTLDRLHRWQEGERLSLWSSRAVGRPRRTTPPSPDAKRSLATSLAREGFDRKACAALLSKGLCPESDTTAQALQALHPRSPPPSAPPLHDLPVGPDIAPDLVARCLRAFPSDTAPGPTGLRVQQLKDACVPGGTEAFLAQLAAVVQLLAHGRAPACVSPVLGGAGLVALPKPTGGVRPIAVGEILRRLTGKCLMSVVREDARQLLWPVQVGVAVPNGAEVAIHTVRAWSRRHMGSSTKVLLKLDFSNAFNCVSRAVVLEEVRAHFPQLARWATWCYGQPSRLQFGARTLESCCGVQQGDPLGPLFFSVALHKVARTLRQPSLDLALFYLDDGVLAGDLAHVASALQHLQAASKAIGLDLNLAKCELAVAGPVSETALQACFPAALLCDGGGAGRVQSNFDFLGAAIGDDTFIRDHTADRAAKAGDLLDGLAELTDPQVGLRLLRACGGFSRMVHSMRCNPPHSQSIALDMFDGMTRRCFGDLTGVHPTTAQWQQAARGLAHGGLGLRSCEHHASAAFLASVGGSLAACAELDPAFSADEQKSSPAVSAALAHLNAHLPPHQALSVEAALSSKQRDLSHRVDAAGWAHQLSQATPIEQAVLHSEASVGGRAFLAAVPHGAGRMEPAAFCAELRLRLLVPDADADAWCPRCDGILDRHSYHAATCIAGGERTRRHHAVRDLVCQWAVQAGLRPEKEAAHLLLPQSPDDLSSSRRRPADIFIPALAGSPAALDFAVTAHTRQETLALASQTPGAAAAAYAQHKVAYLQTGHICQQHGIRFLPMVVEPTGNWDDGAMHTLKHIAHAAAARTGADPAKAVATFLQELCVVTRSYRACAALRRRAELAAT